ncbi:hypothetical protein JSO63_02710 [Riemerella anatipestifer]|uniref:DUF7352 domain-containing protein n=1 Tax=Riemerella anatipestifer TaxID=34085 RepID=UPI002364160C|nr:hypothetical protein [Riemerella anatipestifer]MDD1539422.1 hypothetical protein [Riemerella anatipestifer]
MKKVIYKYPLQVEDEQIISMPKGAEILTVQEQQGKPCLWALANPQAKKEEVKLVMVGTGDIFNTQNIRYIGTCQLINRLFPVHIFIQENL